MENPAATLPAEAETLVLGFGQWVNRVETGLAQLPGIAIAATEALKDLRDFRHETTANFKAVDARFEMVEARLRNMDGRLGNVEGRLGNVESLLVKIAAKLDIAPANPSLT
ncbi:hypothetical protein Rhe02_71260 [Rhizocola hellebori]|uniref:Uncharacterized protein n=1 Tax=Rhizocola hellebori TaxID=1392758 RepID=A0A8J3QE05_9ACTN|nr:hypothetical protein [Rhizocola hellebori]GIH09059.1 hypothetical protein Rhe02_71260 [Rhizocola hellebori]